MAKFVVFFKFKGQTLKAMMEHPSDRAAVVSGLATAAGGRMECYYLMFGQWDGLVILEAPDSKAAAALSLAVASTGAFAEVETHELLEAADLGGILQAAKSLTYTPPGA